MVLELGVDISNWSGPITAEQVDCWKRAGRGFVVVGTQNEEITRQQLSVSVAGGLDVQAYSYLYFRYGDPAAQVREGLRRVQGFPITMHWQDFEDSPGGFDAETTVEWMQRAVDAGLTWAPCPTGLYTGYWWWSVTGNTREFIDLPLWVALYDGRPTLEDCPELMPGWKPVMKQYRGSHDLCGITVDANVREKEKSMADEAKRVPDPIPPTFTGLKMRVLREIGKGEIIRAVVEERFEDASNGLKQCFDVEPTI